MKNITLILIVLLVCIHSGVISQSCLPEGITFTTQQQIDNFQLDYPGCTEIEGDVQIGEYPNTDIENLNGLNVLTSIGGDLYFTHNHNLTSLTGLENLIFVYFPEIFRYF